jgi:hypothetical protein
MLGRLFGERGDLLTVNAPADGFVEVLGARRRTDGAGPKQR